MQLIDWTPIFYCTVMEAMHFLPPKTQSFASLCNQLSNSSMTKSNTLYVKSDSYLINGCSDVAQAGTWTGAETVLQQHQALVANLGKQSMRAFVIFNGGMRRGITAWHGRTAWPLVLACDSHLALFFTRPSSSPMTPRVTSKYKSSREQSVPVCCPHRGGGWVCGWVGVWGEAGTIVLLL